MMRKKHIPLPALLLALAVAGCTNPPTLTDEFRGTSYALALNSQILDPEAGKDLRPVEGVDGETGKRIVERYHKGFEQEPAKTENYSVVFEGMTKK